ncbi:MAG: FAD-dependent oxidoreductase [Acidobacteriota bacterium]|nr:FAD-dependent oxidoreductase [Acidobacteriota bacterium]
MNNLEAISPIPPTPVSEVASWETESDVVVVGYGCAGASAAIGAMEGGASVTILERAGAGGGASAMAGGEIYMGGGTPIQKACGFDDTPQAMFDFLMAATGPSPNEEKLSVYCDRSVEHFHWLVECGVTFKPSFYATPCWEPPTDDGLVYTGGENAWPFSDLVPPAPRGHVPQIQNKRLLERSGGWELMRHLSATVDKGGAAVRPDTRVRSLIVDDGKVVGVIGRSFGQDFAIRARHGVVLASGGFAANKDMVAHHVPAIAGQMALGTDGDDGTSIRLGQGVGAMVAHLDAAEAALPSNPPLVYPSLLVNQFGQRFINEDTYCGRIGQMAVFHQQGRCSLVLDEAIFESVPEAERWGARPTYVAATLAELEEEMSLPTGSLQATVETYNRFAREGHDPMFHKRQEYLRPLEAPFGGIPLDGPYATFTLGGMVTTIDGEVRGANGSPIPGLYAAGRATWGIPSWGYASGTSLGDGTFFGRRAGRAAARS